LGDLTMLAAISAHARFGTCRASVPTLAKWLCIHERTARKRAAVLKELGFVRESSVPGLARAKREIVETSGPTVEIEVAGLDMDDAFGLLLLLMALGLPYTGALDDLARTAGISRGTLNVLLSKLVERGFLTLERKTRALFCVVPAFALQERLAKPRSPQESAGVRRENRVADLREQALAILRGASL
jgi:DNA-binding IclR family transcriptional regulator